MNIIITDLVSNKYAAEIRDCFELHERECHIDEITALETWHLCNAKITTIGERVVVLENCYDATRYGIYIHRPDFVSMEII